jgi:8-oxo-dGTP diphosphatase
MSVKVGVGIIIEHQGKVLMGKRIGGYAPYYSIPGGSVEEGESFEEAVIRETLEECNLRLINPKVIGLTNNLRTFKEEGIHFVSIILLATEFEGELKTCEPDKCESWEWHDPKNLPQPHFEASEVCIANYLSKKFY